VSLHDWIDELCDVFDIEHEVDEAIVLDLARDAAHSVERPAAPITTYLLGYAAAVHDADPDKLEELSARATELAEKWAGDEVTPDDFTDADEIDEDEPLDRAPLVDAE
jgi:hypothetical protein